MENRLIILILVMCVINQSIFADVCPPIHRLNPNNPPAGWTLVMPPIIEGEKYYFGSAIHSLNGSFYYKQVLCKYEACPSAFCPAFTLLSIKTYESPYSNAPPWHHPSSIGFTFTCRPPNHDSTLCIFK